LLKLGSEESVAKKKDTGSKNPTIKMSIKSKFDLKVSSHRYWSSKGIGAFHSHRGLAESGPE